MLAGLASRPTANCFCLLGDVVSPLAQRTCACTVVCGELHTGECFFCFRLRSANMKRAQGGFLFCSRDADASHRGRSRLFWCTAPGCSRLSDTLQFTSRCHPGMAAGHIRDPEHFALATVRHRHGRACPCHPAPDLETITCPSSGFGRWFPEAGSGKAQKLKATVGYET